MANTSGATFNKAQYTIELKIKDQDYSADINRVRIVSSLATSYQIILLNLFLDSNDIILKKILGQDPIKLTVSLVKEGTTPDESAEFDLMILNPNFSTGIKTMNSQFSQPVRTEYNIMTIPRDPFQTITTNVNSIFFNKTPREIITNLIPDGVTLKYDTDNENKNKIDQVIIPPGTLAKAIQYLDRSFGLYDGPCAMFCNYDNTLTIQNLATRIKKKEAFTIYQLSSDDPNSGDTIKKCGDGINFYTYSPMKNSYIANSKFAALSKTKKFIAKPNDQLFYVIENDLNSICKEFGLISKNDDLELDNATSERVSYDIEDTGYETDNTPLIAKISKQIANLSTLSIGIERNLPILNLMQVGNAIKLITKIVEHINLTGKYILKSSDITLTKQGGGWDNTCIIHLIRTNQSI